LTKRSTTGDTARQLAYHYYYNDRTGLWEELPNTKLENSLKRKVTESNNIKSEGR
jgi:hypothetical protein